MKVTSQHTALFGPYSLDLRSGELRKFGTKVKMGEQAFQILRMLLQTPGELVTREELREELWASDTFVDFDHGLNSAVQRLRDCLSDSAGKPHWVETIPRRGYRFIGEVKWSDQESAAEALSQPRNGNGNDSAEADLSIAEQPSEAKRRARIRIALLVAATVVLLSAVAGITYRVRHPRFSNRGTVVLADFVNTTGDAVFDDTLKTALSVSFRQSPFFNVLSDSEVAKTLQLMTRPVETKLTPEVTRELCQRAGGEAYLAGAIASLGTEYVLGLKAISCHNGDTLAQDQVTAASKEKVLDALGRSVTKVRGELGESLATLLKFDVPLEQATTPSLEALKAHSLGTKAAHEKGPVASLPYDQHAIELDPNFAMGYWAVGTDYSDMGEAGRANEYLTKAFQLREHASRLERLRIIAGYYLNVTGELDKAAQILQEEIETYPRELSAYFNLALAYAQLGQYEKTIATTRLALRLEPDRVGGYELLSDYTLALQRLDESRRAISDGQAILKTRPQQAEVSYFHSNLYGLAFLAGDSAAMAEQEQWFRGQPQYENNGIALASDTEAYSGHARRARDLTKRAVDSAIQADSKEIGAIWQANAALQQAAYGETTEASKSAAVALELAGASLGVKSEAALAFAMAGDTARGESLAGALDQRFPLETQMQLLWLPAIHAQVALNRKNPALALNALQAASTIELANIPFVTNISCLYDVYIRGEAYLAARQGIAAAAEFQKILDHSGIVWNCWTGALAHLGVARANALQAKTSRGTDADAARLRARAAYRDFLVLWKDADPGIPVLKQAKAEYAQLQ